MERNPTEGVAPQGPSEAVLAARFPEASPPEFYRDLFPEGSLAASYGVKGSYCALVGRVHRDADGRERTEWVTVTDDLSAILGTVGAEDRGEALVPPASYAGTRPLTRFAHELFAVVIGLGEPRTSPDGAPVGLEDLLYQMEDVPERAAYLPTPTYVVSNGAGLDLYYLLDEPVRLLPKVCEALRALRHALARRVANRYVSSSVGESRVDTIARPYRAVGTLAKGGGRLVRAFRTGERVTVGELNAYVPEAARVPEGVLGPHHTLEEARELWPDWDPDWRRKRAEGRGWHTNRALYDWWRRRVESGEPFEGNRYYCLYVATCYAAKCPDVTYEEHEAWCHEVRPFLDSITRNPENRFTERDVADALSAYGNPLSKLIRRETVALLTGLPMPASKRNGRDRKAHVKYMAAIRDAKYPNGEWRNLNGRPKGSPNKHYPKRDAVVEYAREHPDATQREISAATGVSLPTVNKWVRWMREQGDPGEA
jgi:hypothetical protein